MDDRTRTMLGLALMLAVAILPSFFLRRAQTPPPAGPAPAAVDVTVPDSGSASPAVLAPPASPESPVLRADTAPPPVEPAPAPAAADERSVAVTSDLYELRFSTLGARLTSATIPQYQSFAPGDSGLVQLVPEGARFLEYALVFGNDTVSLADWRFEPSTDHLNVASGDNHLTWVGRRGNLEVTLEHTFRPDNYIFDVTGSLRGLTGEPPLLLVGLGPHLRTVEVNINDDRRAWGVVTKEEGTTNHRFSKLNDAGLTDLSGPFEWIAIKSKYFITAVLTINDGQPRLAGGTVLGTGNKNENGVWLTASLPMSGPSFSHSVYIGPQEFLRLAGIGHDLEDANPYGWIFRPIVRPVSLVIVRALLWGHEHLKLHYGVLLILFGIGIRMLLWPLNQKAMRSQMAQQALQPELEEIRKRYANDQAKVGEETMKLFKERGINPLGGCLPMLLPLPILLAFFFVFLNTIELRGVSFLWLPDLSRADPLRIIPILMGLSMFMVSKMGQAGAPPNPQAKMMTYMMPAVFTVMFMNFASGLNLYYASQNLASLPQQWLLARERKRLRKT